MSKEKINTLTQEVINQAVDMTDVQHASISELGVLFSAIRKASDEHTEAYRLAGMGMCLADDWAEMAVDAKDDLVAMG